MESSKRFVRIGVTNINEDAYEKLHGMTSESNLKRIVNSGKESSLHQLHYISNGNLRVGDAVTVPYGKQTPRVGRVLEVGVTKDEVRREVEPTLHGIEFDDIELKNVKEKLF